MTGKNLIIYILSNNLEDEPIFKDGKIIGFLTDIEAAERLSIGVESVRTMVNMGILYGFKLGDVTYVSKKSIALKIGYWW